MTETPLPYREALLQARAHMGQMDFFALRRIQTSLRIYAERISRGIESLPPSRQMALTASRLIIERAAGELDAELARTIGMSRSLTFEQVLQIWQHSAELVAALEGVPGATLGSIGSAPLTMLNAFDAVGSAFTWRSLIRGHVTNAAIEANEIVRNAITEQVDPVELSRRMRRYVQGSEPFDALFESVPTKTGDVVKLDLRRVPIAQRGAAKQMLFNANRIAVTEIHHARGEAEIQHFNADPGVAYVRWQLAPDRGTGKIPDQCDVLAHADFYGLGPGRYPLDKVPPKCHPHCRCEYMPVTRHSSLRASQKPMPSRILPFDRAPIPGGHKLTPDQAARVRARAGDAVRFGEEAQRLARRGAA